MFASLFGNPVDIVRVTTLIGLDGEEVFGAAGAALVRFAGGETTCLILLTGAIILWVAFPLLLARFVLERQDI